LTAFAARRLDLPILRISNRHGSLNLLWFYAVEFKISAASKICDFDGTFKIYDAGQAGEFGKFRSRLACSKSQVAVLKPRKIAVNMRADLLNLAFARGLIYGRLRFCAPNLPYNGIKIIFL